MPETVTILVSYFSTSGNEKDYLVIYSQKRKKDGEKI